MTSDIKPSTDYVLDSTSDLGRQQLERLDLLFDRVTTDFLADVGVWPGMRCLDLGSGSGSIARWLSDRVGPTGRVVSVEINTDQLDVPSQVEVHRHDLTDGLPVGGTFDLIHARLVLMHLPDRERVLRTLLDALAPGGWLVLGETPLRPQEVLAAPSSADADLVDRIVRTAARLIGGPAGIDWTWAYAVERHLADAGMQGIRGFEHGPMISGGDPGALLMWNYLGQITPLLFAAGVTEEEVVRFHDLMADPDFRAWPFLRLVTTAGRKPLEEAQR